MHLYVRNSVKDPFLTCLCINPSSSVLFLKACFSNLFVMCTCWTPFSFSRFLSLSPSAHFAELQGACYMVPDHHFTDDPFILFLCLPVSFSLLILIYGIYLSFSNHWTSSFSSCPSPEPWPPGGWIFLIGAEAFLIWLPWFNHFDSKSSLQD